MEPIIYKPGAYKSPGIYNGAGGIYKGRGVYNDGGGKKGFVYETDFSRFDKNTGIDIPNVGEQIQFNVNNANNINYESVVIGGITYNMLSFYHQSSISLQSILDNLLGNFQDSFFTVEYELYKYASNDSFLSCGASGCDWVVPIAYNNYLSRKNKILSRCTISKVIEYYNGFYNLSEDFIYGGSDFDGVERFVTAGLTKKGNEIKMYMDGKKVCRIDADGSSHYMIIYNVNNSPSIFCKKMCIWENVDKFEQME